MKYIVFFVLVLVYSCSSKDTNKEYKKVLSFFDEGIVSHFPHEIPYKYSFEYDTIGFFNTYSITLAMDLEEKTKKSIQEKYNIFSINDSCIIVVNDFLDSDNIINPKTFLGKSKYSSNCDQFKIIPNFWNNDFYEKTSKSKLNQNFIYAIIDSQKGHFNNKVVDNISFMPSQFQHGYSKGYSLDTLNNKIIYWSIVW